MNSKLLLIIVIAIHLTFQNCAPIYHNTVYVADDAFFDNLDGEMYYNEDSLDCIIHIHDRPNYYDHFLGNLDISITLKTDQIDKDRVYYFENQDCILNSYSTSYDAADGVIKNAFIEIKDTWYKGTLSCGEVNITVIKPGNYLVRFDLTNNDLERFYGRLIGSVSIEYYD